MRWQQLISPQAVYEPVSRCFPAGGLTYIVGVVVVVVEFCCIERLMDGPALIGLLVARTTTTTTVIAVLVHDPILKWSVNAGRQVAARTAEINRNPLTALFARKPDVNDGNLDAERALMRVKQKLDGYEDGELRSIMGQVRQLLHDARDPFKLAAMYPGWAPWV